MSDDTPTTDDTFAPTEVEIEAVIETLNACGHAVHPRVARRVLYAAWLAKGGYSPVKAAT